MSQQPQLSAYDAAFLKIISGLFTYVTSCAESAALTIIESSGSFLNVQAQQALQNFHLLYSEQSQMSGTSENYNRDVDDIFDTIQDKLSRGEEIQNQDVEAKSESDRVTISGLQKQLETIIRLDAGIKEKLLPVLTSMQFEDIIKSRLNNLSNLWQTVLQTSPNLKAHEWKQLLEELGAQTKSVAEREQFFELLCHSPVPEKLKGMDSGIWLDDLAS